MLCPEIWNFNAPASNFEIEKSDILADSSWPAKLNNFYFNHLVSLTVPDTLNVPKDLSDVLLEDCEYYKICSLNASEFINTTFIDSFIKSGTLALLSINRKIDCDDCLAITSKGKLVLSLTKDSYQALGLEGVVSHFCTSNRYKYIVKVDLANLPYHSKIFERTNNCLKRLRSVDVILTWEPPERNICPSSVAKYFDTLLYDVKMCQTKYDSQTCYSIKSPILDLANCDKNDCAEYVEWLGMLALNADIQSGSSNSFITTYEVPEPNTIFGQVRVLTWRGLFSGKKIQLLLERLQNYQKENNKLWMALYVQGFSDAPVSWGEREHHYYTNGDNSYTIFLNSEKYVICSSMSSYKRYNKKQKNKK